MALHGKKSNLSNNTSCCNDSVHRRSRSNILFWSALVLVVMGYILDILCQNNFVIIFPELDKMSESIRFLMDNMWMGLVIVILFVGLLGCMPREFISSILGKRESFICILRATVMGLFLDLCGHGILLIAMRLYQLGASLGQVMSFLIASTWNSLSLTVILISLIGWSWTLLFMISSMIIGVISGLIFDLLVKIKSLPSNPNKIELNDFEF